MKKVAFHTLGCKVNQYETQAMSELFQKSGYVVVEDTDFADVYVINTCTVTNVGDKKSRQFIRRAKKNNTDAIISVVGCYAQTAPKEVLGMEGVNIVIGTNDRSKIVQLVEKCSPQDKINTVDDIMKVKEFEEMSVQEIKGKTRAFLKIQEGCNRYCSYCIIPYARGPIRSRRLSDIIIEVKRLVENGFKEIVLTGIHVASYGKDLEDDENLMAVLRAANAVEGLRRIRLSSLEPTIFTEDFLRELVKIDKLCQHFHLSLQSGSDKVLKGMNRRYTAQEYREIVARIRGVYPEVALTTDIIVGFPGETDEEFETTYSFVKEMSFSEIHVFKYSPRKGTPAAEYPNQLDGVTKHLRSEKLIALGEELKRQYQGRFVGRTMEVLYEYSSTELNDHTEGLTETHLKVVVPFEVSLEGELRSTLLQEIKNEYFLGKIL